MTLTYTVGSRPDRDDLVADLISDDTVWAESPTRRGAPEAGPAHGSGGIAPPAASR